MEVVGILREKNNGGVINTRQIEGVSEVYIPEKYLGGAPFNLLVVCELIDPIDIERPMGKIIEVIGQPDIPDVAIAGIIRTHGLPTSFSDEVLKEAEASKEKCSEKQIKKELKRGRKDLRKLTTLTIDGKDAKDLDDAISIRVNQDQGYTLWVHIADVAHFVKEDGPMGKEAQIRGNSTYLVDRVIPMLPPALSNGVCSLNPYQDRFALTVEMTFTKRGKRVSQKYYESVINSDLRANYTDVFKSLDSGNPREGYEDYFEDLKQMRTLAQELKRKRKAKGYLNFDFPERKVDLDETGQVTDIYSYPVNEANEMIEVFMVEANACIAEIFCKNEAPFIYRIHEEPDEAKLDRFFNLVNQFDYQPDLLKRADSKYVAKILDRIQVLPQKNTLEMLLLRSLPKARYENVCKGHYGLALKYYCHFTSPIRRYADLFIHRVIKASINKKNFLKQWTKNSSKVSEHISSTERTSMMAERDTVDQKAAEFMKDRIGEISNAEVSGFSQAGFFVKLENTVEGMIPFRTLPEYFVYDEDQMIAYSRSTGFKFEIGMKIQVQVAAVDVITRRIDFALYQHPHFMKKRKEKTRKQRIIKEKGWINKNHPARKAKPKRKRK